MYQVTAIWNDQEVGYGESENYEDAAIFCCESVDTEWYPANEVIMTCLHGVLRVNTPLDVWLAFA